MTRTENRLRLRTPPMPTAVRIKFRKKDFFCLCGNEWFMCEAWPGDPYTDSPGGLHYHCACCDLFWSSGDGSWNGFSSYQRSANYRWAKGFVWRPGMKIRKGVKR